MNQAKQSTHAETRALILDFGGVISRTLFETHDLTEQALGLPAGTLTWRGPFDAANDALWRSMQAGHISERDYWHARTREVGRLLGEDWHDMQTLVLRARGAEPSRIVRPQTLALIESARAAGKRLAILSNELDLFYGAALRQRMACLQHFEAIVDATYTQVLKPHPQAYALCLQALQLQAQECAFVDDQMRNIEGARELGLKTVWFDVCQPQRSCDEAAAIMGLLPA